MVSRTPITVCGSLSLHPVSLGATLHGAGYAALDLRYVYAPFAVVSSGLPAALEGMRALGIRGLGVSMPFKLEVMPLLDAIDPLAVRIGAVNTIVNDDGFLTGHNTDALGAVRALEEARDLHGARCLVLGAGGAARAVVHGIVERGATVTITNRDRKKADDLAARAGCEAADWNEARRDAQTWEIVINATSIGMEDVAPNESPLETSTLRASQVVMDIVYKPIETLLIKAARTRGAVVVSGARMLLHQAAGQFELYTGKTAPLQAMDTALRQAIG